MTGPPVYAHVRFGSERADGAGRYLCAVWRVASADVVAGFALVSVASYMKAATA
jgi:hypothetical protein